MPESFQTPSIASRNYRDSSRLVPRCTAEKRWALYSPSCTKGSCSIRMAPRDQRSVRNSGCPTIGSQVPGFNCRWHRLKAAGLAEPKVNAKVDLCCLDTGETESYLPVQVTPPVSFDDRLSCEGYFSPWPEGVSVDLLGRQGLPYEALPDGRQVFFIPDVDQFGSFTPKTWSRLVDCAEENRRAVTLHAYDVSLGALQLWKKIGPLMGDAWKRCKLVEDDRDEFHRILDEVDPSGRNRKFAQWICYWAKHLYENPSMRFTASKEALKVLQLATGLTPSGIESVMWRRKKRRAPVVAK